MNADEQECAVYVDHERWPTWAYAMAHCAPEIRDFWTVALVMVAQRAIVKETFEKAEETLKAESQ
jgi:hypothetical protein